MRTLKADLNPRRLAWIGVFTAGLIWSVIQPHDYPTWVLEASPAIIAAIVLWFTRESFPLTTLTAVLILLHCLILFVGAHYTYAEVPLFDWIREVTGGQRNNYDKLGHFIQGLVPAIVAREILLRNAVVNGRRWLAFFVICFCLALSAFYELIEWWVALVSEQGAESFLGTQGYVWDTQSDMFWALTGAVAAFVLFGRWHDAQLARLGASGR